MHEIILLLVNPSQILNNTEKRKEQKMDTGKYLTKLQADLTVYSPLFFLIREREAFIGVLGLGFWNKLGNFC